jgi:hypothetical protein
MNDLTLYEKNIALARPGDAVFFWGKGPLSFLIEWFSRGPSHCGAIESVANGAVLFSESTIENGVNGVQTNDLASRVATYDKGGSVVLCRLSAGSRVGFDPVKFQRAIERAQGAVTYGVLDLAEFLLPILELREFKSDSKHMVCSAWLAALWISCGVLSHIDYSKMTPADLLNMALYRDMLPLLGPVPKAPGFNTI